MRNFLSEWRRSGGANEAALQSPGPAGSIEMMVLKREEKDMAKARGRGARRKWTSPVP